MFSPFLPADVSKHLWDLHQFAVVCIASYPLFYDPLAMSSLVADELAALQQHEELQAQLLQQQQMAAMD